MNAVTTRTTTADTGETVHEVPVLVDYHMNDGYELGWKHQRTRLGRDPQLGQ